MGMRLRVCSVSEIEEGVLKSFAVEGVTVPILVTMVDGAIIAGTSMCPHEDVSLVGGCIEDGTIVCRAHGYAFDLQTGECSHDPTLFWRLYKTSIGDGILYAELF